MYVTKTVQFFLDGNGQLDARLWDGTPHLAPHCYRMDIDVPADAVVHLRDRAKCVVHDTFGRTTGACVEDDPAPVVDAAHPPDGYRLVTSRDYGLMVSPDWMYFDYDASEWRRIRSSGHRFGFATCPVAKPFSP